MAEHNDNPQLLDDQSADAQFLEAVDAMKAAARPKVRVRILLQLYRFGAGQRYKNWRGLIYRLEIDPTVMAASNFRTALSMCIEAMTTLGPAKVVDVLQQAMKGGK